MNVLVKSALCEEWINFYEISSGSVYLMIDRSAKERKIRIWKNYSPVSTGPAIDIKDKSFQGKVYSNHHWIQCSEHCYLIFLICGSLGWYQTTVICAHHACHLQWCKRQSNGTSSSQSYKHLRLIPTHVSYGSYSSFNLCFWMCLWHYMIWAVLVCLQTH